MIPVDVCVDAGMQGGEGVGNIGGGNPGGFGIVVGSITTYPSAKPYGVKSVAAS